MPIGCASPTDDSIEPPEQHQSYDVRSANSLLGDATNNQVLGDADLIEILTRIDEIAPVAQVSFPPSLVVVTVVGTSVPDAAEKVVDGQPISIVPGALFSVSDRQIYQEELGEALREVGIDFDRIIGGPRGFLVHADPASPMTELSQVLSAALNQRADSLSTPASLRLGVESILDDITFYDSDGAIAVMDD